MLWIIGKISKDFRQYFTENNIPYGIFEDTHNQKALNGTLPHIPVDFASRDSTLKSLQNLDLSKVTGVLVTGYEHYVLPAAWMSEYLHVPGLTPAAATAATDKSVMRRRFTEHSPELTPEFATVKSWQDIEAFMNTHTYPVMLKPTNLMKSMFVTKNTTEEELHKNYHHAATLLPTIKQRFPSLQPTELIIEEYLVGSMHTVAGFTDAEGKLITIDAVVDCQTAQDIGLNDNYLFARTLPSHLNTEQQNLVRDAAIKGVAALGLTSTPFHAELIVTARGPKIIEIGARMGGYRPQMYKFAENIDMYKAAVDIAYGKTPSITPSTRKACAYIELFPTAEGSFQGVKNQAELKHLPTFKRYREQAKPGDPVGPAKSGHRAAAVIMLGHDGPKAIGQDIDFIRAHLEVQIKS